jgi:hypothetical protein
MATFAGFAALGSLVFAAAGLVLTVLLRSGTRRRTDAARDDDVGETPEAARRVRTVRRAEGIALGCFAAAAALGVLGVVQHSPDSEDRLVKRIQALEHRLESAELELESRAIAAATIAAIEKRSATTNDGGAKSERAAREVPDADAHTPSVVTPPHRNSGSVTMPKPAVSRAAKNAGRPALSRPVENHPPIVPPPPEAAPSSLTDASPTSGTPSLAAPASAPASPGPHAPVVSAPLPSVAAAPPLTERDVPRRGTPPDSSTPTLAKKVRNDWEMIKRAAREGGDDWAEGWHRLRRLFTD